MIYIRWVFTVHRNKITEILTYLSWNDTCNEDVERKKGVVIQRVLIVYS